MAKIKSWGASPLDRPLTILAPLLMLASLPVGAATVEVHKSVRDKTSTTLGIPAEGVPRRSVKLYKADRAAIRAKAAAVFAKNPVAAKVRGRTAKETENDRAVQFRNRSIEFEVSKAVGAEILLDLGRYARREIPTRNVDEKAIERDARQYVKEHMPDVDPNEVSFVGVKKIMDSVAKVADDGKLSGAKSGVANYIVIFQRKIANVPVVGPGEKIRVYFSSNGEVIGHSKIWREVDKMPKAAKLVVPPERVQQALEQKLTKHPAPKVEIDFFEFGYRGEGRYTSQDSFDPIYLIGYKAGEESKRVIEMYDAYTGAEIPPPADPAGMSTKRK